MTVDAIFDFDLSAVSDDPDNFPDGTYKAFLYKCEIVKLKDASKGKSLVFTYRIAEGEHQGKEIGEWKPCNSFDDAKKKSYLKQRLLSLGIPESRLNSLTGTDLADLAGTSVLITKKQNGQWANVSSVRLDDGNESATTAAAVEDLL